MVRYVAGDIGGTNSRLQLMEIPEGKDGDMNQEEERVVAEETYPSQQYASLTFVIQKFLNSVRANKSVITNVNWILDGEEMAIALNMQAVQIINDFVGVGYGLLALERSDVVPINDVPITAEAPKACIGAGTGLGEAYLTWNGEEYDVWSSEGGHADFAPRDEIEFKLLQYFKQVGSVPRVSVERVVSGMGIPRVYDFYCTQHSEEVSLEVQQRMRTEDAGSVIAEMAQSGKCDICRQTIDTFVSCYGAEAGNLALKTLPFGGLYIAGGIAPKLLWAIEKDHQFWHNFVNKGRMRGLLEKVPTFIVTHKQSHFSESTPRGVDVLRSFGRDVEAVVDSTGKETGAVVVRKARTEDRSGEGMDGNAAGSVAKPTRRVKKAAPVYEATSDLVLIRAAVVGGLIASVATLLLHTVINRYAPAPASKP